MVRRWSANDGFGVLKQMFAKGYAVGHAGETSFAEYSAMPDDWQIAAAIAPAGTR